MYPSIKITTRAARKISAGYPWVFRGDIESRIYQRPGIVDVIDKRGNFVGHAFLSPESNCTLRIFSTAKTPVNNELWRKKLETAFQRRYALNKITDAYRVVYAESDFLPSVIIDKFNDIFAIQITSSGAETVKDDIVKALIELFKPAAIIEKNDTEIRKKEKLPLRDGIIFGDRSATRVREGDQHFDVDLISGQKTGAYLDYRAIRFKAREFAKGNCLDAFCYQGWFACQIAAVADKVTAVDSSAAAIAAAKANAALNGHKNIQFVVSDVFDFLKNSKETFDFIHLDPPSFVKQHEKLEAAISGYQKLIRSALKHLAFNGTLLVSSCSHHISERILENTLLECLKKNGLHGRIVYRGIQDSDHPIRRGFPESLYLKAFAARIMD